MCVGFAHSLRDRPRRRSTRPRAADRSRSRCRYGWLSSFVLRCVVNKMRSVQTCRQTCRCRASCRKKPSPTLRTTTTTNKRGLDRDERKRMLCCCGRRRTAETHGALGLDGRAQLHAAFVLRIPFVRCSIRRLSNRSRGRRLRSYRKNGGEKCRTTTPSPVVCVRTGRFGYCESESNERTRLENEIEPMSCAWTGSGPTLKSSGVCDVSRFRYEWQSLRHEPASGRT